MAASQIGNLQQLHPGQQPGHQMMQGAPQLGQLGLPLNFGGAPTLLGSGGMDVSSLMMPRNNLSM